MSARGWSRRLALAGLVGAAAGAGGAPPALAASKRGRVVEVQSVRVALPGVRAAAWRLEYVTGGPGGPALASAAVIVPTGFASRRRSAVVGVGLGNQGLADACAPSRNLATGTLAEASMLADLVRRGFTVVVADGLGLGSPGLPTVAAAATEGPVLLDAIRAARALPAAAIGADWPVGLLGYSVGAAAVAQAAAIQPRDAPEVPLVVAAVGGVPVDLPEYVRRGLRSGASVAALSALVGLRAADPALPAPPLTPIGELAIAVAERSCIFPAIAAVALLGPARPSTFVTADPFADPRWQQAADRQWPGADAPQVPVLLFHAARDQAVPIGGAVRLRDAWRAAGASVSWWVMPTDHIGGLLLGVPGAIDWLAVRLPRVRG